MEISEALKKFKEQYSGTSGLVGAGRLVTVLLVRVETEEDIEKFPTTFEGFEVQRKVTGAVYRL